MEVQISSQYNDPTLWCLEAEEAWLAHMSFRFSSIPFSLVDVPVYVVVDCARLLQILSNIPLLLFHSRHPSKYQVRVHTFLEFVIGFSNVFSLKNVPHVLGKDIHPAAVREQVLPMPAKSIWCKVQFKSQIFLKTLSC